MSNLTIVENKLSAVRKYLHILERYKNFTKEDIEGDIDRRGAVERYLYLVVQATIDLAESIIAYRRFRKPSAMSEAFEILSEQGIIALHSKEQLIKMTGFRNVIAHDYEKIDYTFVYQVLHEGVRDIEAFLEEIARAIVKV